MGCWIDGGLSIPSGRVECGIPSKEGRRIFDESTRGEHLLHEMYTCMYMCEIYMCMYMCDIYMCDMYICTCTCEMYMCEMYTCMHML